MTVSISVPRPLLFAVLILFGLGLLGLGGSGLWALGWASAAGATMNDLWPGYAVLIGGAILLGGFGVAGFFYLRSHAPGTEEEAHRAHEHHESRQQPESDRERELVGTGSR